MISKKFDGRPRPAPSSLLYNEGWIGGIAEAHQLPDSSTAGSVFIERSRIDPRASSANLEPSIYRWPWSLSPFVSSERQPKFEDSTPKEHYIDVSLASDYRNPSLLVRKLQTLNVDRNVELGPCSRYIPACNNHSLSRGPFDVWQPLIRGPHSQRISPSEYAVPHHSTFGFLLIYKCSVGGTSRTNYEPAILWANFFPVDAPLAGKPRR